MQTHLTGDEKGESADFLDHLFRALGHDGIKEAGATRETRLAKKGGAKGKNFADLLFPESVLFEMKSRGKKLERQYDQIFDYWTHIVPHRPPYVILCNFDEFWIYDFNQQLFDPVEKIALADLPTRAEALAFLLPKLRKPLFNNNRVEVTREAAADLARLFRALIARGEDRTRAQRFVLQLLVTLVSEDMNLLPRQILARLIAECREKAESSYDLIGGLFRQMNTKDPACGSGNFLYVAYRELKRLEREILLRLSEISEGEPLESAVSIHQFFGIDIQPVAVELAKVTLMLAKEQEIREAEKLQETEGLLVLENPLPLDNLDKNILCAEALFTEWPKADAIVGNPPFISKNKLVPELGQSYVDKVRKNWWNLYLRFYGEEHHREAVRTRPMLMSGVGRQIQSGGRRTVKVSVLHEKGDHIARAVTQISNELHHIRAITERWSVDQRWTLLLTRVLRRWLGGKWLPGLPEEAALLLSG